MEKSPISNKRASDTSVLASVRYPAKGSVDSLADKDGAVVVGNEAARGDHLCHQCSLIVAQAGI